MPLFENNGNGVTIPKWLLPILIGLFLTGAAAWASVSFQAKSALSKIEAAQTYVPRIEHREDLRRIEDELKYMNAKLDQLIAR